MELGLGLTKIIPLVLYCSTLLVVVWTLMSRIEVGIYFLVPLIPQQSILDSIARYPGGKDIVDILVIVLLIKWWANSSKRNAGFLLKTPANMAIFALMAWTFLGLWLGSFNLNLPLPINLSDPRFVTWKNFMILPLLYFIVVNNIEDKRQIKILLGLMALSMLFMDRHFYNNFRGRTTTSYSHGLRSAGTFSYLGPNELAAFYAQYTLIVLSVTLLDRDWRARVFAGIVTVFNYYCLVYLFSRGGYLATLAGWSFLGLIKDRRVVVAIILLFMFWKTILPNAVIERIEMTQTEQGTDTSVLERLDMWNAAVAVFKSHPVTGIGYDTTPYFGYTDSITKHHRNNLHNGYLQIMAEMGVVGLLIFLILFFKGIGAGWRLYKTAADPFFKAIGLGFSAGILASLTANFTGYNWHYFNVAGFFWVTHALVVRSVMIFSAENNASQEPMPEEQQTNAEWKPTLPSWPVVKP